MKGKVYLVGAGPGDPELLTLKALRLLQTADAVLHDDLVAPEILKLITPIAQIHNVGKRCGTEEDPASGDQCLLVALAASGLHVVRLKGGDPLIFGRAGEEIEVLRRKQHSLRDRSRRDFGSGCGRCGPDSADASASVVGARAHHRPLERRTHTKDAAAQKPPIGASSSAAGDACDLHARSQLLRDRQASAGRRSSRRDALRLISRATTEISANVSHHRARSASRATTGRAHVAGCWRGRAAGRSACLWSRFVAPDLLPGNDTLFPASVFQTFLPQAMQAWERDGAVGVKDKIAEVQLTRRELESAKGAVAGPLRRLAITWPSRRRLAPRAWR